MKGITKLAIAFIALALVVGSLLVFISPIKAHSTESLEENGNTDNCGSADSCKTYIACGGIENCRTSCGCGCRGDTTLCGCSG